MCFLPDEALAADTCSSTRVLGEGAAASCTSDTSGGVGVVFARGGRVKEINSRFFNNRCGETGPDLGGGALRVLSQYEKWLFAL